MSLDGAITNLASWAGNTMMPTMAGLFFAGAVYRYSKGGPFEQFLYGGFASLMCSGTVARLSSVRDAFNSPFRPFVLATTSVGQEGLDFHPYCYRVYHWNLPGNPVDLEQREGRIHRFKGHAIRLNIASRQADTVRGCGSTPSDPWKSMFDCARLQTQVDTELVPYWIYEGPVKVERRVLMLPFSREVQRLAWLKRSLAVYRLAFGQPRQDDLLDYLQSLSGEEMTAEDLADLQIRLEPIPPSILC